MPAINNSLETGPLSIGAAQQSVLDTALLRRVTGKPDAEAVLNRRGRPACFVGGQAYVFRIRSEGLEYALRIPRVPSQYAQSSRVRAMSAALRSISFENAALPVLLNDTLQIGRHSVPCELSRWCDGLDLQEWAVHHLAEPKRLIQGANRIEKLVGKLEEAGLAHGDLSHGNIIMGDDGEPTFLDWDGGFCPDLAGRDPVVLGHPHYAHPERLSNSTFDSTIDQFPLLVITTALRMLSRAPSLWTQLGGGSSEHDPDCLLFRNHDYESGINSPAFKDVTQHSDSMVRALGATLLAACGSSAQSTASKCPAIQDVRQKPLPTWLATRVQA